MSLPKKKKSKKLKENRCKGKRKKKEVSGVRAVLGSQLLLLGLQRKTWAPRTIWWRAASRELSLSEKHQNQCPHGHLP